MNSARPLRATWARLLKRVFYIDIVRAALPWLSVLLVFLVLVTYVPAITLWLPSILF